MLSTIISFVPKILIRLLAWDKAAIAFSDSTASINDNVVVAHAARDCSCEIRVIKVKH